MAENLGEQIRIIRTGLEWSQIYLAEKAGVSRSVISNIEVGKQNNPSIGTLWRIANALGMPLSELLNIECLSSLIDK